VLVKDIPLAVDVFLNTHTPASLYKASEPEKAGRFVEKTRWHYTAKHGGWLNMAECEISVLARAALKQRTGSLEKSGEEAKASIPQDLVGADY